jgi:hypothetical protein
MARYIIFSQRTYMYVKTRKKEKTMQLSAMYR